MAASSILCLILRTEDAKCPDKCDARHTRYGFAMLGRGALRGCAPCEEYLGFSFCRI